MSNPADQHYLEVHFPTEFYYVGHVGHQKIENGPEELQPWTKYLRQTLVFMRNNTPWEKLNLYFSETFASIDKTFSFGGALSIRL